MNRREPRVTVYQRLASGYFFASLVTFLVFLGLVLFCYFTKFRNVVNLAHLVLLILLLMLTMYLRSNAHHYQKLVMHIQLQNYGRRPKSVKKQRQT